MAAVKPNLLVGALGAAVFLITGSIIVAQWRELTGTATYQTTATVFTDRLEPRSTELASGATATETYSVLHENVSRVTARVTWSEGGFPGGQHSVTVALVDPDGKTVATESGTGGVAGVDLGAVILRVPSPTRIDATSAALPAQLRAHYPPHPETRGLWRLTITADAPTAPGTGGISYQASFEFQYYVVSAAEAPAGGLQK